MLHVDSKAFIHFLEIPIVLFEEWFPINVFFLKTISTDEHC